MDLVADPILKRSFIPMGFESAMDTLPKPCDQSPSLGNG